MWRLLQNHNSVWVKWIQNYRLRDTNFWRVRKVQKSSWIWRKLLDLREVMRDRFVTQIGNGRNTNAWEDIWLSCGRLSSFISYATVCNLGFRPLSTVHDVVAHLNGIWPTSLIDRCSVLSGESVPNLTYTNTDKVLWRNRDNVLVNFSVKEVYKSLDVAYVDVSWSDYVWFKGHIPKHSFTLWLAILGRLPTQDRMRAWMHENAILICPLCSSGSDSHSHLFFGCSYSMVVWKLVKIQCGLVVDDSLPNILASIATGVNKRWLPLQKLSFAATVYLIWRERNARIFSGTRWSLEQLAKDADGVTQARRAWMKVVRSQLNLDQ